MTDGAAVVQVKDLTIKFGAFVAVDNISFAVERGEIFGFLGANGAGKTTTIRALCGLLLPSAGSVSVAGAEFIDGEADQIKRKVGYMSQRFTLYNDLTVDENLVFAARLRKLDGGLFEERKKELLDFVGFTLPLATMVQDLAGGVKQELSLAVSLLHDPEVIFLDEPTAGVSPTARLRFWALIRHLSKAGKTVFVTTHYMDEAEECGRIALMSAGRIIALDTPARLKRDTFPETVMEVEETGAAPADWLERLKKDPSVLGLKPHGLRYYAIVRNEEGFGRALGSFGPSVQAHVIQPSLEDVFIRLVERAER